ncbi:unnamed protein product [Vitrella brassicaformis CCMP3155]|uniref:Uncharacterized protein n=1 Tax=Vitrella brassicaformis (strain CCMP3155) TaxID=1169540 RepID=A0A0G4G822_VITBC|nr:unnamed protein product [Vitrella brassicaformis CCMP3155]|eukprot:CEM24779.1 unnamed protein product [Vitrella brassicaformis CCMP3155]
MTNLVEIDKLRTVGHVKSFLYIAGMAGPNKRSDVVLIGFEGKPDDTPLGAVGMTEDNPIVIKALMPLPPVASYPVESWVKDSINRDTEGRSGTGRREVHEVSRL